MFNNFKKNIFSQNGEDGILNEITKRLNISENGWCCEFGAWDGKRGSNTFNLVKNYNYKAVYIESDKNKFKELIKTKTEYPNITAICKSVDKNSQSSNSLENILKNTPIPFDFDILSIDIDSYDLEVWESINRYHPKIVIIEVNSSIEPGIILKHGSSNHGNSFSATVKVGEKKGYKLVCHTGNCIFIKKEFLGKINLKSEFLDNSELLFDVSWLNKKENKVKKLAIKILPNFLISFLKKFF